MANAEEAESATQSRKLPVSRAFGRSLSDFGKLSTAEKQLLGSCRQGTIANISEELPDKKTRGNQVRAAFIRFLALGGDETTPIHERGVQLQGAWLTGILDLEAADIEHRLPLWKCRIEQIDARHAKLKFVNLSGSLLEKGLNGDSLFCQGNLFLRHGFKSTGEVRLLGAQITGILDCSGGEFTNPDGMSLSCDGIHVSGMVLLGEGFRATGAVRLLRAVIGDGLHCTAGSFENEHGDALICDAAEIGGLFYFRDLENLSGAVSLAAVHADTFSDDLRSWDGARGKLVLDGFTYKRLAGGAPIDAAARIAWLELQSPRHLQDYFKPQPWEQLIKVLREMGHPGEARAIAVEKQERLRRAGRLPRGTRFFHWMYGALVGYGYRPLRLLAVTATVWLLSAAFYWAATNPAPGRPYLLAPPLSNKRGNAPADYPNFVPLIYSIDVLLPVIDLGYKEEWQPIVSHDDNPILAGQVLRFLYWFEIVFGWIAGLLLVGVLGNLVKKD
jgi:hypothetical protein